MFAVVYVYDCRHAAVYTEKSLTKKLSFWRVYYGFMDYIKYRFSVDLNTRNKLHNNSQLYASNYFLHQIFSQKVQRSGMKVAFQQLQPHH